MPCLHVGTRLALLLLAIGAVACSPRAQSPRSSSAASGECESSISGSDRSRACEVREFTLDARPLRIDATPNGGIQVEVWDRDKIQVRAEVSAWARSGREAIALLREVAVETSGSVRARLPESRDHQWTSVSYRVLVPRDADLDLRTVNGGITVRDVAGVIRFDAVNGGVSMLDVGGDVSGETTNGGIDIRLARGLWRGNGMSVATQNGGIEVDVPSGVSAEIDARTAMGPVQIDGLPLEDVRCGEQRSRTRPCMGGHAVGTLGDGGAMIRLTTTNGPVRLRQR